MDDDYIDFQAGSLLTADELNTFDTWQLYIDQELADKTSNISSGLPGSYVTQLVAGSNITLSPADGKGVVTINGEAGGGGGPTNTDGLPEGSVNLYYTDARVETYVNGAGYVKGPVVSKLVAGNNVVLSPSTGEGIVTITSISGAAMEYMGLIDATQAAPANPRNGDLYVNTAAGTVDASWAGIAGESLTGNERLVWDENTSTWGMIRDFGVPEAPADGEIYGRKDQDWEVIPAASAGYWSLSGSDLYPTDPSYSVGIGGSLQTPNIVLTAAGDVTAISVTATATVEAPSVVATGGGFSGTALQLSEGATVAFGTSIDQKGNVAPLNDWSCYPARS